ncbi:hypothetical protein [Methylobacterium fujisawaense]|uniref:hypothetical protein n=1 Tax=Methylobacterium fujisawaense TaxID=107400 RepID=UPI002F358D12
MPDTFIRIHQLPGARQSVSPQSEPSKKMPKSKKIVSISFNVTPEVAEALDAMLWPGFDTRASYVRDLLVHDLQNTTLLKHGVATTPAMARARRASLARLATA